MSYSTTVANRKAFFAALAIGLLSGLLYVSIFLSFLFLLPLQIVFGRWGRKYGTVAALVAVLGISIAQALRIFLPDPAAAGTALSSLEITMSFLPPIVMVAALLFLNAELGRSWKPIYKALIGSVLAALSFLPMVLTMVSDTSIASYLQDQISAFLSPLKSAATVAGDGYDASALMAALDPKEIVADSILVLRSCYAAMIFLVIAASWRIGNRVCGAGSQGWEKAEALDAVHLPFPLVWAFLAAWFAVLATLAFKASDALASVAWNCALILSLAYAAQGLGIFVHLFKIWNMPKALRVLIAITAVMSLASPLGLGLAAFLPLFGVTEVWIPYRKPKGVGA